MSCQPLAWGDLRRASLWTPRPTTSKPTVKSECRVLAERKIAYHSTDINKNFFIRPFFLPMKTWSFYIYGSRGIVGFVRKGDYNKVHRSRGVDETCPQRRTGRGRLRLSDVHATDALVRKGTVSCRLPVHRAGMGPRDGLLHFPFRSLPNRPKEKKFRLENLRLRQKLAAVPRSSRRSICSNDMFVSYHFRLHWSLSRSSGRKRKLRS